MSFDPSALGELRPETQALHAGQAADPTTNARAVPIYATTSYVFDDAAHAARLFGLQEFGNIYTRIMNPTTGVFEERVAALEGGVGALGARVRPGGRDAVDPQPRPRRPEHRQLEHEPLRRHLQPVPLHAAQAGHHGEVRRRVRPRRTTPPRSTTTPARCSSRRSATRGSTSPTSRRSPTVGHAAGVPLIVDNTCAPLLVRPIEHGADIVIHSATKWIGGHGTVIGGVVVDGGKFDWAASAAVPRGLRRRPIRATTASPTPRRSGRSRSSSSCASRACATSAPRSARSTRSSSSRASRRCRCASSATARTPWRSPSGCRTAPRSSGSATRASSRTRSYEIAKRVLKGGYGGLVTFGIKGGADAGRQLIDSVKLFSLLANVGDAKSLIIHPASTTHQQLDPEEQEATGVTAGPRPAVGGHRAHRRHPRGPRPGAPRRDRALGASRS